MEATDQQARRHVRDPRANGVAVARIRGRDFSLEGGIKAKLIEK